MTKGTIVLLGTLLFVVACQKEHENPFAQAEGALPNSANTPLLPLDNFAGIHQRILRPSCALSGCHDGHFEPDFRSVAGSYNSLVFHPVVGNDPNGSFTHRVQPGNADASYLHERLTAFVPNTSGMMPLGFGEDSDWPANSAQYINAIRAWIQAGALDMFGQAPTIGDQQPQCVGLSAFPQGATAGAYARLEGAGVQPIAVPATTIDLWFAFTDDNTAPQQLAHNMWKIATAPQLFPAVPESPFNITGPIAGPAFTGGATSFTHRATLDLSGHEPGTTLYVRAYVGDGAHPVPVEIPNDNTAPALRDLFTLRIVP
ncbi:MAG: hypothetical protein KF905_03685 [Flavobacteriales bacterium]|nr:hypothetical protein [Flavobacteriales bacterium]